MRSGGRGSLLGENKLPDRERAIFDLPMRTSCPYQKFYQNGNSIDRENCYRIDGLR